MVYDKVRRDYAEKFLTVDCNEESSRTLVAHRDDRLEKFEVPGACRDLHVQLGWALHKP